MLKMIQMIHSLQSPAKEFLGTTEIAEILGVTRVTAYRWVKSGMLKGFRIGRGSFRVLKDDFDEFLDKSGMVEFLNRSAAKTSVKILVVDDNPKIVESIKTFLERAYPHYHVVGTTSSFEAGQLVMSFRPDVVVLDLLMPGLDGFAVCRRIKSDPFTKNMAVIAMTGYGTPENLKRIKDEGAAVVLIKPFDYRELATMIEDLIKPRK